MTTKLREEWKYSIRIKDATGMFVTVFCHQYLWNAERGVLSLYEVLESGEYEPADQPGMMKVKKSPQSQLIGVYVNPMSWEMREVVEVKRKGEKKSNESKDS